MVGSDLPRPVGVRENKERERGKNNRQNEDNNNSWKEGRSLALYLATTETTLKSLKTFFIPRKEMVSVHGYTYSIPTTTVGVFVSWYLCDIILLLGISVQQEALTRIMLHLKLIWYKEKIYHSGRFFGTTQTLDTIRPANPGCQKRASQWCDRIHYSQTITFSHWSEVCAV